MRFPRFVWLLLCSPLSLFSQNIPNLGSDTLLEAACWNIEWYGNTGYGPSNEALQQQNVTKVLQSAGMDLWALSEVSDSNAWKALLNNLPDYAGVITNYAQVQKTALLFRRNMFELLRVRSLLPVYEREFASGRLPLEVMLSVKGATPDTLWVIVLHMKANTGTNTEKADAYDLRKRASEALKDLLDTEHAGHKVVVLGDWNDDLDLSIYNNLATPFSKILADTARYLWPSRELTLGGQRSTVSYSNMIDHMLVNRRMKPCYISGSAKVFYLQNYITSYGTNTSDHYPVYARFDLRRKAKPTNVKAITQAPETQIWRNGASIFVRNLPSVAILSLYSPDGRCLYRGPAVAAMPAPAERGILYWEVISTAGRQMGKLAGE
jgi:endonuclease/exonuclease/phosphatase family metal-dependent hydrolase